MSKTPVTYKETKQGILEIHEIEQIIMDNLILVPKYVFRHYKRLAIGESAAKKIHRMLAADLFTEAGLYRAHDVEIGTFRPPPYYQIREQMKNWEEDYQERERHAKARLEKIELCAWLMHRFLWIHQFFDYNGRISRLLGELYLLQNQLPIVSFRSIPRVDFVKAVQHATATGSLALLIQLMSKQMVE